MSNRFPRISRTRPAIFLNARHTGPSRIATRSTAITSSIWGQRFASGAHRCPVRNVSRASGNAAFNERNAGSKRMTSPSRAKRIARIFTAGSGKDEATRLFRRWGHARHAAEPVQITTTLRANTGIYLHGEREEVQHI